MMMNMDKDWEAWTREWHEEAAPAPGIESAIERRVRRQSARLALLSVMEGAVALGLLALSAIVAADRPTPLVLVWAGAIWILVFVAWGFSLWNRRGIWRPAAQNTRAFVEVSLERCARRLRTVRFAAWLLVSEVLFLILWGSWEYRSDPGGFSERADLHMARYGLITLLVIGISVWLIWLRRRTLRERDSLGDFKRALSAFDAAD
jgi:hypothetical protein